MVLDQLQHSMYWANCSTNSLVISSRTGMHSYLYRKIAFTVTVSPEDIQPPFVQMNKLYQQDVLKKVIAIFRR